MERNAIMSCPFSPDFPQPFFLNSTPFLQKTAENGKDRPWQGRTDHSSLSKYLNSTSFSVTTSFSHIFAPFFLCFWPIYNHSRVCQNKFEGLSNLVQGSVEDVQGHFCIFPIKIHLLMASLRPDWSNTTEILLYNTIFAAVSGNTTIAASFPMRSCIALLYNT